jgi:hypothetical protein
MFQIVYRQRSLVSRWSHARPLSLLTSSLTANVQDPCSTSFRRQLFSPNHGKYSKYGNYGKYVNYGNHGNHREAWFRHNSTATIGGPHADQRTPTTPTTTTATTAAATTTPTATAAADLTRFSLCLPRQSFEDIVLAGGIQVTVDGMEYRFDATPMGTTQDVIDRYHQEINTLHQELLPLQVKKDAIDLNAAQFTKKIVVGAVGYLVAQAVVVAKLTFASRLGWDIMEPITYLVTFSTGIFGLFYFSVARRDYMYETVWDQVHDKRKTYLYRQHVADFDIEEYERLRNTLNVTEMKLARLLVA